jgi:hypothetical protein
VTEAHLRPCPSCARHARVSEPACPFCGGELGDAFRSVPSPRAPAVGRLSRAVLFALGAGGLTVATACGGEATARTVQPQPGYGGAACDDACIGIVPEASVEASAESAPDAAIDATTASMPDAAPEAGSPVDASAGDADAGATADAAPDAADAGAE